MRTPYTRTERDIIRRMRDAGMGPTAIYESGRLPGRSIASVRNACWEEPVRGTPSIKTAMRRSRNLQPHHMTEYGCLLRQDVPIGERHQMFGAMHGDGQ